MTALKAYFKRFEKKTHTLQIRLESANPKTAFSYSDTLEDKPFHSASVGKVFASALIMMAIESKNLRLDTKVADILDDKLLDRLFVYKGKDYKDEVTLEHLLGHTSGVNDYFEGKVKGTKPFMEKVLLERDHQFTPYELLDFTRDFQEAVGRPGEKFVYSDTGYVLLGLVLETMHEKPYAKILREKIFTPLGLEDTLLAFYDERFDATKIAPIHFKGHEMSQAKSLSCDHAGGGIITTTKDLARFLGGLFEGELIDQDSLRTMMRPRHRFHGIMRYGLGMVEVKLHRVVPWKVGYPTLYGGLGSLSVHAFYDPLNKEAYIINLGDPALMRRSFMALTRLMTHAKKERQTARHKPQS
ncbi:MAG: serine hydrolase [Bacillota bacterium]